MHTPWLFATGRRTSPPIILVEKSLNRCLTHRKGKNLVWLIFLSKRARYTPENLGFCPPLWNGMTFAKIDAASVTNVILRRCWTVICWFSNGANYYCRVFSRLLLNVTGTSNQQRRFASDTGQFFSAFRPDHGSKHDRGVTNPHIVAYFCIALYCGKSPCFWNFSNNLLAEIPDMSVFSSGLGPFHCGLPIVLENLSNPWPFLKYPQWDLFYSMTSYFKKLC